MTERLRDRVKTLEATLDGGADDPLTFGDSCMAFCRSLRRHHMGEDAGAFGALRRHDPDLGDVIDELVRDHEFLDPLLDRLEVLASGNAGHNDNTAIERELAGIAAVLENHLSYEERILVSVFDRLDFEPGSADDRALRAPLDGILDPGA